MSFYWRDFSSDSPARKKKRNKCRCPDDDIHDNDDDDEDEDLEDRREALFAMMGSLWAVTSVASSTLPAYATVGVDANMAFPDVIGSMNDRLDSKKECLMESLGTRECMIYKETDPDKLLYKGANLDVLVKRIQQATVALAQIPPLVETKKWNEITGILTGPMGQLSSTLTMLCGDSKMKVALAQKVKQDLFAIGTATTQRQTEDILKYHALAIEDLTKFLEASL